MNPFRWISDLLDRIDELEEAVLVVYCVGVLLIALATHAYDEATSLIIFAVVGFISAIPASLVIAALLRLLAELFEKLFQS